MTIKRVLTALVVAFALTACSIAGMVKMNLSTYEEPLDGPRARLRLISDQPSPFVYPGLACADNAAKGAGVAPESRSGPMGGLEHRKIGMPSAPVPGGRAMTELYARAGEPITFTLTAGGCAQGMCPMDATEKSLCHQTRTFVPDEGVDYVATILRKGAACDIQLFRIVPRAKQSGIVLAPSEVVSQCANQAAPDGT